MFARISGWCVVLLALISATIPPADTRASQTSWVLSSGAEVTVQKLGQRLTQEVRQPPSGISVRGDLVTFAFTMAGNTVQIRLSKEALGLPKHTSIPTIHGVFNFPEALTPKEPQALASLLNSVVPAVPWKRAEMGHRPLTRSRELRVDKKEHEHVRAARKHNLALRHARSLPSVIGTGSPLSLQLSAGKALPLENCPACDSDVFKQLRSSDPRLRLSAARALLRKHPTEVRIWSVAADASMRIGRVHQALALADVATRLGHSDALALQVWHKLTGQEIAESQHTLPHLSPPNDNEPWTLLIFVFGALSLLLFAWASAHSTRQAFQVALVASVALVAFFTTPNQAPQNENLPVPPSRPDALLAPLAGSSCTASPGLQEKDGFVLFARCDEQPFTFHISANPESGELKTAHHGLRVLGPGQNATTDQALLRLKRAVENAEKEGFRVPTNKSRTSSRPRYSPSPDSLEEAEWATSRSLVFVSLLLGLLLTFLWAREIMRTKEKDALIFYAVLGLFLVYFALHILIPSRMVMVYTGYDLTERLAMLEATPRYGAGGIWLYTPFLTMGGADHSSVQFGNRIFGLLTFFPLAFLVLRHNPTRTGCLVLLAYVILPLGWRDHTSEAIMSGTMWLMLTAMAAFTFATEHRTHRLLLPAAILVACAAATVRPEVGPALAIGLLGLWFLRDRADTPIPKRELILGGFVFAALLLPHLVWLGQSAQAQVDDAAILTGSSALSVLGSVLTDQNLLFDPTLFPIPWWAWILAAPFVRPKAWVGILLLLLAAVFWVGMSAVDLPTVSIPRVHLPALLFLIVPMAIGSKVLLRFPWTNTAIAFGICVASAFTVPHLLAPSNADEEEALIREALEHLTQPDSCLVTIGFSDPPSPGKTQRHFPHYLFSDATVLNLSQYASQAEYCTGDRLALLGTRCYMHLRTSEDQPAPSDGELETCRQFRKEIPLETIVEHEISNRRTFTFPMYPNRETLTLGLYRLGPPSTKQK
jgi:hypothetical protein